MKKVKVALCFRGLIRTGIQNKKMFDFFFKHPLVEIDYFLHTWNIDNVAPPFLECEFNTTQLWKNLRNQETIKLQDVKLEKFLDLYKPKQFKIDDIERYFEIDNEEVKKSMLDNYSQKFHPQFISVGEVDQLRQNYELANNFKYDVVISTRPDLVLNPLDRDRILNQVILNSNLDTSIYIGNLPKNWDINNSFVDDILYIGNSYTMSKLGSFFNLQYNKNSHLYLLRYLVEQNLSPKSILHSYTILRSFVDFLDPVDDFYEIFIQNVMMYDMPEHINTLVEKYPALEKLYEKRTTFKLQ